jgi:acyl-CoA synthetase (AMP-forming)/AMP-acid ligase II
MFLLQKLHEIWRENDSPFLIYRGRELRFSEVLREQPVDLHVVKSGDVVAIIGDFNPESILTLLRLIDLGVIVVPLTNETRNEHEYFFDAAAVNIVVDNGVVSRREVSQSHQFINELRHRNHAGLVLFSTGTTGRPKAILHDLTAFLKRFETPRPSFRTINFLLFDHIGGINTLFHTLFNRGCVVAPEFRTVDSIIAACEVHSVEVLPTTPTFLRMMLMSGVVPARIPKCLRVITYGTERMDQPTLDALCDLLPNIDFRQTFGMSELGIVRVKSEARNSLYMKVGGEGVETRVVNNVLHIRSASKMLGYLNAPSPFDEEGWYDTKDVVEIKGEYIKVVGRISDVINVGGLKFMASEVERVALMFSGVELVKATAKSNPLTGQHVELLVQPVSGSKIHQDDLMAFLKEKLQPHMVPKRIRIEGVSVGHRFKRA